MALTTITPVGKRHGGGRVIERFGDGRVLREAQGQGHVITRIGGGRVSGDAKAWW
jgi:hypothetical protein